MRKLIAALFALILIVGGGSSVQAAAPAKCTVTGTVYNNATGNPYPNVPVRFWYQPNTQNISGGIVTNAATPNTVYTQQDGTLPTVTVVAGSDQYIQVNQDTPQLTYVPTSCGGSSIDLNALMGNPDPPLSPVVTGVTIANTSSLAITATDPVGIGKEILTISGQMNSAGNGTITFDNSGNIVANGNGTFKGGNVLIGVSTQTQGCIYLFGQTSGYNTVCAPATNGSAITLPQGAGSSGYIVQTDGSGNWSYVAPPAGILGQINNMAINPDGVAPTTTMDLTATKAVTVNPSNSVTTVDTTVAVNDLVVGSQSGSAANGRDQASAFGTSVFYYYYIIDGAGHSTAALTSLTPPPTGPTLPSGYTSWVFAGAFQTDGSGNVLAMYARGNRDYYQANFSILSGGSATSSTNVPISTGVPPYAQRYQLFFQGGATASSIGAFFVDIGLTSGTLNETTSFYQIRFDLQATSSSPRSTLSTWLDLPYITGGFYYRFHDPNSITIASPLAYFQVQSYDVPGNIN